jgi:hypothetical protein
MTWMTRIADGFRGSSRTQIMLPLKLFQYLKKYLLDLGICGRPVSRYSPSVDREIANPIAEEE